MSELPNGWCAATIADVTSPFVSIDPRATPDQTFRYVDIGSIDNKSQTIVAPKLIKGGEAPSRARRIVRTGDSLFSTVRTYLRNIACVPQELDGELTSTGIAVLRPNEAIDARYLFTWVCSDRFVGEVSSAQDGTMYPAVTDSDVTAAMIRVPPLSEQRRIVATIDSLSAKSKRARDHLDHIPRLVEKYKQAILAAAFRGDLTADWRATNANSMSSEWKKCNLVGICDPQRPITYGVIKLGSETPNGVPCLRTSNVRWLRVDTEGMKRISSKLSFEYARTVLRGGEVLVNVRGTLGGVAVATPSMNGWNVSREVAVAPIDTAVVDPDYVAYWIGADASQRWLNRVEKGVAYTGINIEDLRKLPVEFPSIEEQREIVRRVRAGHSKIDLMANEAKRAGTLLVCFDQAVLAKAFRGELVPQDPNDEPASVLLERIRAERAADSARRGPKRAVKQPPHVD